MIHNQRKMEKSPKKKKALSGSYCQCDDQLLTWGKKKKRKIFMRERERWQESEPLVHNSGVRFVTF